MVVNNRSIDAMVAMHLWSLVQLQVVDKRGRGYKATAFFAKIKLRGRVHPALFTAGHVFDLTESGVDSRSLKKVHLIFNNLKVEHIVVSNVLT